MTIGRIRHATVAALLVLSGCGGGGGGSEAPNNPPPPPPPPPPAEGVTAIEQRTPDYCESLPTTNGGFRDLRAEIASFTDIECGKYVVSCGGSGIDPKNFFAAVAEPVVTPVRGTILSFSGESGDHFHTENVQEYVDAGFRVVMIAYESIETATGQFEAWQCPRGNCPQYVNLGDPGPKESACRPAEIIRYFKESYDPAGDLGYCAQGHSAGSSQIAYALAHYDAEDYLDYVQLTGWTPFARPDFGCDPARYDPSGVRGYSGENPDGTPQSVSDRPYAYDATGDFARHLIDQAFGLPPGECGAHPAPGVSNESFTRLHDGGIVSDGADYVYPNTVMDFYACAADNSMVDGNGAWYFEHARDANPGQVFMQTVLPGTSDPEECYGEVVWWKSDRTTPSPIRQLTIDRMVNSCIPMH